MFSDREKPRNDSGRFSTDFAQHKSEMTRLTPFEKRIIAEFRKIQPATDRTKGFVFVGFIAMERPGEELLNHPMEKAHFEKLLSEAIQDDASTRDCDLRDLKVINK